MGRTIRNKYMVEAWSLYSAHPKLRPVAIGIEPLSRQQYTVTDVVLAVTIT